MRRRQFLKTAGQALSIPFFLNGIGVSALAGPYFSPPKGGENNKVLVLIRLNGGNDGLNTLIPLDQYSNLFKARSNIIIPEKKVFRITDTLGLHPSMPGIKDLYDDGKVGIVQSVGYPNQNRSHFRSTEIWMSGSPANEFWFSGWLGRYFDEKFPGFPDAYPNSDNPDPFAISMGRYASETCQGQAANFSMALNDPFSLAQLPTGENTGQYSPYFKDELAFITSMVAQTNSHSERIIAASERGRNTLEYPDTDLGQQLKNTALLISGGMQSKVYIVSLGGFDTHSAQTEQGNSLAGEHASLLKTLSDAVKAFQDDIKNLGLEKRVIGMTFSEFGRQIRSNGSYGSDHGEAAPLLLFGSCVNTRIMGQNPEIRDQVSKQEAVPMQFDFRDVYGSVLMDWFEYPEENVRNLLHQDFKRLPIISGCEITTSSSYAPSEKPMEIYNYPNPFKDWTSIHFTSESEWVRLSVFNAGGQEISVLSDQRLTAGDHQVNFEAHHLPAGNYFCRMLTRERQRTRKMLKIS